MTKSWDDKFDAEVGAWLDSFPPLTDEQKNPNPKPHTSKCPECGGEGPGNVCPRCDPWHYGDGGE